MQTESNILALEHVSEEVYRMELARPEGFSASAGQFIQMKVAGTQYPLLRRPISIYDITEDSIILYIKKAGHLTRCMSEMKPGETIDFIGPLGTTFQTDELADRTAVLVGGGIGIAPVAFLAKQLNKQNAAFQSFLGFREQAYALEHFSDQPMQVHLEAEKEGYVTDLVAQYLRTNTKAYIFACGPTAMLKRIRQLCMQFSVPGQISLEERMACGVGACVGCTVRCQSGLDIVYRRVCKEGPVFDVQEVLWDE